MKINTNVEAQRAASNLNKSQKALGDSLTRLSSGTKIVNPSDDAAGLAVSSRLSAQIARLTAALDNVANGVSFSQTQDGYLKSVDQALSRMAELAMLARDGTKSPADRGLYDAEFQQLKSFIRETADKELNGIQLFDGTQWEVNTDAEGGTFAITKPDLGTDAYTDAIAESTTTWQTSIDLWQTSKDGYITKVDLWKDGSGNWHTVDPGSATKFDAGSFLATEPTLAGPILDMPLDGNANDISGNGHNGTPSGVDLTTDKNGNANGGYFFDGTGGDKIDIPHNASLNPNVFTVTAWAKPTNINTSGSGNIFNRRIISKEGPVGSGKTGYFFNQSSLNQFSFAVAWDGTNSSGAGRGNVGGLGTVVADRYYHLVGTYDGTNMKFYIDGQLQGTTAANLNLSSDSSLRIGSVPSRSDPNPNFVGVIDEVSIYDRPLSANEISDLYNATASEVAAASSTNELVSTDPTATGTNEDPAATKITAGSQMTTDPTSVDPGATQVAVAGANLNTLAASDSAVKEVKEAIQQVAIDRANLGASQARMHSTSQQMIEATQNLQQARSRITDVDMAAELTEYTRRKILVQSGTQMLQNANDLPQQALDLIRGLKK